MGGFASGVAPLGTGLLVNALNASEGLDTTSRDYLGGVNFGLLAGGVISGASNAANLFRLNQQLALEEARSAFTASGGLHPDVLANSRPIVSGVD